METERLDLGDGQWWEIRRVLTRGMEKNINRVTMAHVPQLTGDGKKTANAEIIADELMHRLKEVNIGAIEDAYLLQGTVAYSYGPKVDLETIDAINAESVRIVITRMFELYNSQRIPEAERKDFFGKPSPAI